MILKIKKLIGTKALVFSVLISAALIIASCDPSLSAYELDLPEANSIADATPPTASFSYSQGQGLVNDAWKDYHFANASNNATSYSWDFGGGNIATGLDADFTFSGEGTFSVSLTATDDLGVSSTDTQTIEVVMPDPDDFLDPVLVNTEFDRLAKLGGSDCVCSGWDNDDIGEQGESSSGNGSEVVKFDNNEPDHIYQEFAVEQGAEYRIEVIVQFKRLGTFNLGNSMLELRVLAGSGYDSGYTPTYYATSAEYPKNGYGYTTVAQVETAANNLLTETISNTSNPNDEPYITHVYTFEAGTNESVAFFARGIGGASTGSYGYTSGDEEIRMDSVTITAIN